MSLITSATVIELFSQFSHPQLPANFTEHIKNCVVNIGQKASENGDKSGVTVQLTLPYAVNHLADEMASFISAKLDQTISVVCEYANDTQACFKQVGKIVLVASGKGGVGKSTTAVNLALALSQNGAKVGLLDADIYGPSIPLMLGLQGQRPVSHDGKIMQPLEGFGVKVNSIGFLVDPNEAAIWRGPMASGALSQLIGETDWGERDYLVVDMPPGTGDIQLTIAQKFPCTGSVVVTTPQTIALADAQKGVAMFNKVNIPVLGIVENMSYFECDSCGQIAHIFGKDGAVTLAQSLNTELLGQIPLEVQTRENSDKGTPTVTTDSPLAQIYQGIAAKLSVQLFELQDDSESTGVKITMVD